MAPLLTIFTPVYNRARHLPLLHASLKVQRVPKERFEWLVIDDGSQDGTRDVVQELARDEAVQMRYLHKANGGKHSAINVAAEVASGDWIFIVDSDDRLIEGILPEILRWLDVAAGDDSVGIIRALRKFPTSYRAPLSFLLPRNPCSHMEWLRMQRGFDTSEIIRRDVLAANPFPIHPGENFMAESWLYLAISERYSTWFVDRFVIHSGYLPGGLSSRSVLLRALSPFSAMAVYEKQYRVMQSQKVRSAINWWRYYWHARRGGRADGVRSFPVPRIYLPLGWLLHFLDHNRLSRQFPEYLGN